MSLLHAHFWEGFSISFVDSIHFQLNSHITFTRWADLSFGNMWKKSFQRIFSVGGKKSSPSKCMWLERILKYMLDVFRTPMHRMLLRDEMRAVDRCNRLVKWQLVVLGFPMTDKHIKQYLPRTKYESEAIVSLFWNILDTGGTVMRSLPFKRQKAYIQITS